MRIPIIWMMGLLCVPFQNGGMTSPGHQFKDSVTKALDINDIKTDIDHQLPAMIKMIGINNDIDIDEFKHLHALEIKSKVDDIISSKTGFSKSNSEASTVMHWLSAILVTSKSNFYAIQKWKNLKKSKNLVGDTTPIEHVLKLSDGDITDLHESVQCYIKSANPTIVADLVNRIHDSYGHRWNDSYEIKQTPHATRSLAALQEKGLKVKFDGEKIELLQRIADSNTCPLLDKIKNERFLTINGFRNSKIALMIHDCFDHFWTYNLLEKTGILDKYKEFLARVGNPHTTDIFCREGELIASTAFDYRAAHFTPSMGTAYITAAMCKDLLKHTDNQKHAATILEQRMHDKEFCERYSRVISGVCTEIMEQRRKHGFIRDLGNNKKPLATLDPEYVALMTDIYQALDTKKPEVTKALVNISFIMENYLQKLVKNPENINDLVVKLSDIEDFNEDNTLISPQNREWIKKNIGAISHRNLICQ